MSISTNRGKEITLLFPVNLEFIKRPSGVSDILYFDVKFRYTQIDFSVYEPWWYYNKGLTDRHNKLEKLWDGLDTFLMSLETKGGHNSSLTSIFYTLLYVTYNTSVSLMKSLNFYSFWYQFKFSSNSKGTDFTSPGLDKV